MTSDNSSNESMSQEQSLEIIRQMIDRARGSYEENSFFFLLWGWLVLISSVSHYILLRMNFEQHWLPWPVLMSAGAVIAIIAGARKGRKKRANTFTDRIMYFIWGSFVITLLLVLSSAPTVGWHTRIHL